MKHTNDLIEQLHQCDSNLITILSERIDLMKQIARVNKENNQPILDNLIDKKENVKLIDEFLSKHIKESSSIEEFQNIFNAIEENSRKAQIKELFKEHIILIGFMGTGKSTVSKHLSKVTGFKEVDTDALIVEKEGRSIPKIFEENGEDFFRDLESNTIIELQDRGHLIISCGGGIVLRDENVRNMKKIGKVVLLTATPETIYHRVKDNKDRPILNNNMNVEFIEELMMKRKEKYLLAADIVIETDHKEIQEIALEIITKAIN